MKYHKHALVGEAEAMLLIALIFLLGTLQNTIANTVWRKWYRESQLFYPEGKDPDMGRDEFIRNLDHSISQLYMTCLSCQNSDIDICISAYFTFK